MYLNEPTLADIVKKQFHFKLNANAASFSAFVLLQVAAIFMALVGSSHSFYYSSDESVALVVTLSNDMNVGLAMVWALFLGIMLTTRIKQSESFSFVTTRLSSNLANFQFMLFASLVAGISAALAGPTIKLLGFLKHGEMVVYSTTLVQNPSDFLVRILTAIAYVLLLFMIGYFIGSLVQLNKIFIALFVVIWILLTSLNGYWNGMEYVRLFLNSSELNVLSYCLYLNLVEQSLAYS